MPHPIPHRKPNHAVGTILAGLVIAIVPSLAMRDAVAQTILNTERFQLGEVQGPHLTTSLSVAGRSGNSEIFIADASGIAGLYSPQHWLRMIYGGTYLADGDRSLLDSRFLQLRYSWMPTERLQTFHFVQVQQNESLRLRSRWLVGSGVQRDIVRGERTSFSLGTGAMLEWERLDPDEIHPDDPTARDTVRMANLCVLRHETRNGVRILNITYFQPRFDDLGDFRVLNDLGITVPVTDKVRLTLSGEWRRDNRPPAALERDDLSFKMGIALDFR